MNSKREKKHSLCRQHQQKHTKTCYILLLVVVLLPVHEIAGYNDAMQKEGSVVVSLGNARFADLFQIYTERIVVVVCRRAID